MDTDKHRSDLHAELTHQIIGCAMEVINELGHGLHEKPYENGLVIELGLRGIATEQQRRFAVLYKGHEVGLFIPDLIVGGAVIVDAKVIDAITTMNAGRC